MAGAGGGGERRQQRSKGIRKRLLFVVEEKKREVDCYKSYLVFKLNLKDMFAADADEDPEEDWPAMRSFPLPFARFDTLPGRPERLDLALVSGKSSTSIVAVSCDRRTFMYDTAAAEVSAGPELRYLTPGGFNLIPLGTRLYAIGRRLYPPSRHSYPSFQALQPPSPASGRWSWRALPAPPSSMFLCNITATMAAGTRVWLSAPDRGTYSFDTVRLAWRKEGDWELPFQGRGLVVSDLQQQGLLCFGICWDRFCLCAFDVPATAAAAGQPPTARYVWQEETFPRECQERGFSMRRPGSLAYLGDGNFCITWTVGIEHGQHMVITRFALFLLAIQIVTQDDGELRVVKRKVRCYKMSSHGQEGYVLQPSLG